MEPSVIRSLSSSLREYRRLTREHARTLPASFYTSPELLEIEKEYLFRREWMCVGRVEEVPDPGDYMTTDLLGEPVLIVRGTDDKIRALSNVCRHRGTVIAAGRGNVERFVCPYHSWTYDMTGRLLRRPLMQEHADFDRNNCRLPEFPTEIWQGFVYVNLDGNAVPLAPRMRGLEPLINNYHMEQMTLKYAKEEVWETNWKCLTENYMEGYHLSSVHLNTLHPITPTHLCEHFPPGDDYFGYYSRFPRDLPRRGNYHADLTEDEQYAGVMFFVLPSHVAGVSGHLATFICVQPETVESVRARLGVIFYDRDIPESDLDAALDLFERTMAEDKAQLLRLQRGLNSRYYESSPLAPANYEGTVWDFYQYIARKLEDARALPD